MNTLQALKRIHAGEQQGESLVDAPMLDAAAQVATGAGALVELIDAAGRARDPDQRSCPPGRDDDGSRSAQPG